MKNFTVIALGFCLYFAVQPAFACECYPIYLSRWKAERVREHINNSELVFIGEAFTVENAKYGIKVLDVFKGDITPGTVLYGMPQSSCSQSAGEGIWIVYTSVLPNGRIDLELCSLTRNITNPYLFTPPPPPPPELGINYDSLMGKVDDHRQEELGVFLRNWSAEYAMLVAYRNNNANSIAEQEDKSSYLTYIAVALALIALTVALLRKK